MKKINKHGFYNGGFDGKVLKFHCPLCYCEFEVTLPDTDCEIKATKILFANYFEFFSSCPECGERCEGKEKEEGSNE